MTLRAVVNHIFPVLRIVLQKNACYMKSRGKWHNFDITYDVSMLWSICTEQKTLWWTLCTCEVITPLLKDSSSSLHPNWWSISSQFLSTVEVGGGLWLTLVTLKTLVLMVETSSLVFKATRDQCDVINLLHNKRGKVFSESISAPTPVAVSCIGAVFKNTQSCCKNVQSLLGRLFQWLSTHYSQFVPYFLCELI